MRRACGRTMRRMICHQVMPTQEPASSWPWGTLSSAQHGLGAVGTLVEGKGDDGCRKSIQHDAQAGQAVEDDEQLHQQRRAPDDPDVEPGDLAQHRNIGVLHQRNSHCK